MNLVRALFGVEERAQAVTGRHPGDPALAALFGLSATTKSGASVTALTSLQVSAVYSCVGIISDSIAMLPLTLFRNLANNSREKARDHSLYRVLSRRPNRWQTRFEWVRMMISHVLLRGNAYSQIIRGPRGQVVELIPLHPDRVTPFWAPDGRPAYYYEPLTGSPVTLFMDEVHHLRGLSDDGLIGMSPITLHREAIGLAMTTEEHAARLFSNGAQIGGYIKHPKVLSDEAYDHLRKSWADRYSGVANAHKPAILEEGMDYVRLGMTSDEAQFLESRKYQRGEIASIFRVPPHMIGDTDKSTSWGSGIEAQGIGFVTYTLGPWTTCSEQALERDLLLSTDEELYSIKYITAALMRGDSVARKDYLLGMVNGGLMLPEEARALEDLNYLPGLDKMRIPLNMGMLDSSGNVIPNNNQGSSNAEA